MQPYLNRSRPISTRSLSAKNRQGEFTSHQNASTRQTIFSIFHIRFRTFGPIFLLSVLFFEPSANLPLTITHILHNRLDLDQVLFKISQFIEFQLIAFKIAFSIPSTTFFFPNTTVKLSDA